MKPMATGLFPIILHLFSILLNLIYYFAIFTFQSIPKTPKISTLLSLLDLTFASGREGIDNPFIVLVARFLMVCAGTR